MDSTNNLSGELIGASSNPSSQSLKAVYTSRSETAFACSESLSLDTNPSSDEKKIYLSALKKAIAQMQEQINIQLTNRMENDAATSIQVAPEDVYQPTNEIYIPGYECEEDSELIKCEGEIVK
ncbi:putative gon7 family protein [Erysiphe necator]|uniref:EKC/KEOPS complex subunit GON7 n=1 Tax=Uncinula necator TaxID=52586 RepID=A0A0B1PC91_UNCNE|nr:putative gon7 family protein [Erysiphe necator]